MWWVSRRISQVNLITFLQLCWLPSVCLSYLPFKRIFIEAHLVPFPSGSFTYCLYDSAGDISWNLWTWAHGIWPWKMQLLSYFQHWYILEICSACYLNSIKCLGFGFIPLCASWYPWAPVEDANLDYIYI